MNTLFVGSIRSTDTSLHYYSALIRSGHQVLSYDPEFFGAAGTLQKLEQRLKRGPTSARLEQVRREFLQLIGANHWDLIFVMGQNFFSKPMLTEARKLAGPQAKFIFHSHDNLFANGILKGDDFFDALEMYDAVFTTKSQNVGLYKSLGQERTYFLPSAYEPAVHRPIETTESRLGRTIPVSFIGTFDNSRIETVEKIGWEKLEVWGNGWERYPRFRENQTKIHPQAIYYFQFADITSHSSISLGLLRAEAHDRHTQRTFEIPACGTLQLSPRTDEILEFFEEDKEIVCYQSLDELASKADFYLKNESARKKIAEAGYRRCVAGKHSYLDRVDQILETLYERRLTKSA